MTTQLDDLRADHEAALCALRAALMGARLTGADHTAAGGFLDAVAELIALDDNFVHRIAQTGGGRELRRLRTVAATEGVGHCDITT